MPSIYELLQNPILGYHKGEPIDFTAFGTLYSQSLIKNISQSGAVELEHKDGSTDVFDVRDMALNYIIEQASQTALKVPSNPAAPAGTNVETPVILFTINTPGADVYQDTDGRLVLSQRRGQYVGALWVEDPTNSAIGGFGYGPASPTQPPNPGPASGVVNVPPVYYPASPNPPTESVSSGVANFPGYPSQPVYSGYPSQPSYPSQPGHYNPYPSYGNPGYGSAAPVTVINNGAGGNVNIYIRMKKTIVAETTTTFIK